MKARIPDIKTVDTFFEIFSDSDKFMKRMADMRAIRDEIGADLDKKMTKEKADQLLQQAQNTMTEARQMANEAIETKTVVTKEIAGKRKSQKEQADKENGIIAEAKKTLTADNASLTRRENAFEKSMADREADVSMREEEVAARETKALTRENANTAFAKRLEEAVGHGSVQ